MEDRSTTTTEVGTCGRSSMPTEGGAAENAVRCGTDTATYLREAPGVSAFALEDGVVYHTYSAYARGWTGSGACTSGSTVRRRGATRRASGSGAATSTSSLAGKQREQRLVDASSVRLRHRANDALAREPGALEDALGGGVADVDIGGDALDPPARTRARRAHARSSSRRPGRERGGGRSSRSRRFAARCRGGGASRRRSRRPSRHRAPRAPAGGLLRRASGAHRGWRRARRGRMRAGCRPRGAQDR